MNYIKTLHELCDMIGEQLTDAVSRLKSGGGKINNQDADYIDKLTHSMKSVKATIAMVEAEDEYDDGSYDGMSNRGSYRGGSYRMPRGGSYRDGRSYDDGSFARGRGRNARRDSMGRYSREDGYSRADDMVEDLRGMMESAPDEKTRQEFQRFISKMEQMQ